MVEPLQKVSVNGQAKLSPLRQHELREEVDLIEIAIGLAIIVKRYRIHLITSLIVGALLGLCIILTTQPRYKSELVISIPSLKKHELQRFLLGFQQSVSHSYSDFLTTEIDLVDADNSPGSFVISAATNSPDSYPKLQVLLIEHLNKHPFVQKQNELQVHNLENKIAVLNKEEIKVARALDQTFESKKLYDTDFGIADLAKLKIELQKERLALTSELENLESTTVVQEFVIPSKPINKNLLKTFVAAVAGCMGLCVMVIGFLEFNRLVKRAQGRMVPIFAEADVK